MSPLDPLLLETVVAIYAGDATGDVRLGTGFLVMIDGAVPEVFLVTNRHVFEGKKSVTLKFSDKETTVLLKNQRWINHRNKDVDVAVVQIPYETLDMITVNSKWYSESLIATTDRMKELKVRTGDEIYVLGFPLGIVGRDKNFPIVRSGVIARFDDDILKNHHYYVDVAIYGGNSGGPVILKPRYLGTEDSPAINISYVIGVIFAVRQAEILDGEGKETALYQNANLGIVIPMEYVMEAIELLRDKVKQGQPLPSKKKS